MAADDTDNLYRPPPAPPQGHCPLCERADQVEKSRHPRAPWFCFRCDLLFTGTFAEWHAYAGRRAGTAPPLAGVAGVANAEWDPAR